MTDEQDEMTELDLVYEDLHEARMDHKYDVEVHMKRIAKLTDALKEVLEYFKERYDVRDGAGGQQLPNEEMRLGQIIDEALYGIRF